MSRTPSPIPVALLGLSDFERQALDAAMSRARRHRSGPGYVRVLGLDEADFVVADGDDLASLSLLEQLGRVADSVFVGLHAPETAAAWVMRPLAPERVLRELDALHAARSSPDSAPLPWTLPTERDSGFSRWDALRPATDAGETARTGRRSGDRAPLAEWRQPAAITGADRARPGPVADRLQRPRRLHALVVDDSAIARHHLQRELRAFGLQVDTATGAAEALRRLHAGQHRLVFVDLDLGEEDPQGGLKLCRQIRQQHGPGTIAEPPPLVVMVSAFHDPVDQVRGTLAGAEAYLGKPLDPGALQRVLQQLGWERPGPAGGRAGVGLAEAQRP